MHIEREDVTFQINSENERRVFVFKWTTRKMKDICISGNVSYSTQRVKILSS